MTQYFEVNKMPLHVITESGFDVTSGIDIKETELLKNTASNNAPTFFFNSGDHGVEFEVSIIMRDTYFFKNKQMSVYLNQYHKEQTPVNVVTTAFDIPNDKYLLQIKNKKQTNKKWSVWKIRFKQYYQNSESFNNLYAEKTGTYSAVDSVLYKYNVINEKSPKEAILALQKKLYQLGYWSPYVQEYVNGRWVTETIDTPEGMEFKPRVPNGKWDFHMQSDIWDFQLDHYLGAKNGHCDRETITDLIGMTTQSSIYAVES